MLMGTKPRAEAALVYAFTVIPMLALAAAVPLAWGWGLSWLDAGMAVGFYFLSGLGVTVGFHRYFTHRGFTARRRRCASGSPIAGSMSMQGDVITWVADHRRHHAFTDKEGDPHSPWLFGTTPVALVRGFVHAHFGWLFSRDLTNADRFAPDLLADRDIVLDREAVPAVDRGHPGDAGADRRARARCRGGARSPRSSGRVWCGSRCCTT